MANTLYSAPTVAFLGICERASFVREGHPLIWRHNLIGLRQALVSYFYPSSARGWYMVLACYDPQVFTQAHLRLVDDTGDELVKLDLAIEHRGTESPAEGSREQRTWRMVPQAPSWFLTHFALDQLVIHRSGSIRVMLGTDGAREEACIGEIFCAQVEPPPLTPDRIAAIRADPRASKHVRVALGCKKCSARLFVVAGVQRPTDLDGVENVWYEEAPTSWQCQCGHSNIDLTSIRRNLHGALGSPIPTGVSGSGTDLTLIRMYTKGALTDVCGEFGALLDDSPPEAEVQQFLEQNTVFLHRFGPIRIKPKAPILTKYQTDFAVLDVRGMLILIELERPGIKLLKKDGSASQYLQHAFDQVRTWLDATRRHWVATLDCMGFKESDVAGVRGVVVAGRDGGYPSEHLLRLKGADHGPIDFYTFDDLLEDTVQLARDLDREPALRPAQDSESPRSGASAKRGP